MPKTWLITGASSGFGRLLAEAALERGDKVMLTARRPGTVADLVARFPDTARAMALDVTQGDAPAVVAATQAAFGGLDILVNAAGYGLIGAGEEVEPSEYRAMFETNVFGLMEVTKAALPALRTSPHARIVQFSSIGGLTARPGYGYYSAAKFAVEGFSEALALEVEPHGIKVIIVEPGAFRTDFLGRSIVVAQRRMEIYDATAGATRDFSAKANGAQPGDPAKGVAVMLKAIDADDPPQRLPLGKDAYARIRAKLTRFDAELTAWEPVAAATDHDA